MNQQGRCRGFSLIEILVVIVIVGIVMSIAVLSLTLVGGDRDVRQEAQRVISLVEVAQDDSMLQGREFGLEFMQGSYRFVEFDPFTGQWSEIVGDDTLRLRELPEEIELALYIEDRRVLLESDPARTDDEDRNVETYAPPTAFPAVDGAKGGGMSPGAAAVVAGTVGALAGAGAVAMSKMGGEPEGESSREDEG